MKFFFAICILIASFLIVAGVQYLIEKSSIPKTLTSFFVEAVGIIGLVAAIIGSVAVVVDAPVARTKPKMQAIPENVDDEYDYYDSRETCYDKQGAYGC